MVSFICQKFRDDTSLGGFFPPIHSYIHINWTYIFKSRRNHGKSTTWAISKLENVMSTFARARVCINDCSGVFHCWKALTAGAQRADIAEGMFWACCGDFTLWLSWVSAFSCSRCQVAFEQALTYRVFWIKIENAKEACLRASLPKAKSDPGVRDRYV